MDILEIVAIEIPCSATDQNVTAGSCSTFHATAGTSKRLSSTPYHYDPTGNMTFDGSHTYTYDAENRLPCCGRRRHHRHLPIRRRGSPRLVLHYVVVA
jgi:hypothetical protein